jgi:DNA-binding MarR family transcriptional regulator
MATDTSESCDLVHDPVPPALCRWTGALLHRATQRLHEHAERALEPLGIRTRHYPVLAVLSDASLTQIEIGRMLCVDRSTMVVLLDELERLTLVARDRHPEDRRAYAVRLTDAGRETLAKATDVVETIEHDCFDALNPDERELFRSFLVRLL